MSAVGRAKLSERFLNACEIILLENRWPCEGLSDAKRDEINEMDANQEVSDLFAHRVAEIERLKKSTPLKNTTPGREWIQEHALQLRKAQTCLE
jgi:hypothetical protein